VAGIKILVTTVACDCSNVSAFKLECRRFANQSLAFQTLQVNSISSVTTSMQTNLALTIVLNY
jgi:hypothetical protein